MQARPHLCLLLASAPPRHHEALVRSWVTAPGVTEECICNVQSELGKASVQLWGHVENRRMPLKAGGVSVKLMG